jgi:hypothetical protein
MRDKSAFALADTPIVLTSPRDGLTLIAAGAAAVASTAHGRGEDPYRLGCSRLRGLAIAVVRLALWGVEGRVSFVAYLVHSGFFRAPHRFIDGVPVLRDLP